MRTILLNDHGWLKARLRPMRGLKQVRSVRVISLGRALIQNVRRGRYALATDVDPRIGSRPRSQSWRLPSDPGSIDGDVYVPLTKATVPERVLRNLAAILAACTTPGRSVIGCIPTASSGFRWTDSNQRSRHAQGFTGQASERSVCDGTIAVVVKPARDSIQTLMPIATGTSDRGHESGIHFCAPCGFDLDDDTARVELRPIADEPEVRWQPLRSTATVIWRPGSQRAV